MAGAHRTRHPAYYLPSTNYQPAHWQFPPVGRTDDTITLCIVVAAPPAPGDDEPVVPTDALALEPGVLALACASVVEDEVDEPLPVVARADVSVRSRSRAVELALADVSERSVDVDEDLPATPAPVLDVELRLLAAPAGALLATEPTISTRCPM